MLKLITVINTVLLLYFLVILYGQVRGGHWNHIGGTLFVIALVVLNIYLGDRV